MRVEDLDGDGIADSLIRWTENFDYDRPPFLVIHDLRRPGLPAMLSVQFNAHMATLRAPIFDPEVEEPELTQGRWRFTESNSGFPEIVIEWWDENRDLHSNRFQYLCSEFRWTGPIAVAAGFWSVNPDPWRGVSHEDMSRVPK